MTYELTALRSALATLPDPAPPPGFRAWTPSPSPVAGRTEAGPSVADRFRETVRRALAPAMLAGASLAIVGAVGVSGLADGGATSSTVGGAPAVLDARVESVTPVTEGADGDTGGAESTAGTTEFGEEGTGTGQAATPAAASPERTTDEAEAPMPRDAQGDGDRTPWAVVLTGGALLFGAGLLGRRLLD